MPLQFLKAGLTFLLVALSNLQAERMDLEWGEQVLKLRPADTERGQLFDQGNYAMFIHWGLYSQLGNRYQGKTYYGIGEWIMNPQMADIPHDEYWEFAEQFNPVHFDGKVIAKLAKDAGMRYVIVTAKHHEGFAMFDTEFSEYNIVDMTPYGKDPMRELAEACRAEGLGFGFYYSHSKDWTTPGARNGPQFYSDGSPAEFEDYFRTKSFPQLKELLTNYGPLELIWFDTPGDIDERYVEQFIELVREHQPDALVNGRVGQGMGDYQSRGDMEVPPSNVPGMWEAVDTTNDSWAYAWYDNNWKTPEEITHRLISTVARGGTYMLNIGPKGDGSVPALVQKTLRRSGEWVRQYPFVVYDTQPSPWGAALPWGDVTVKENRLFLSVFDMPDDRTLRLPGLTNQVISATLIDAGDRVPLAVTEERGWTRIHLPATIREPLIPVVELVLEGSPGLAEDWVAVYNVDQSARAKLMPVDPSVESTLPAAFAKTTHAEKSQHKWMEKFGEWKRNYQVSDFGENGRATWEVEVLEPGYYNVDLTYRGPGRIIWRVEVEGAGWIQNEQNASHNYQRFPIGWVHFPEAGRHTVHVSPVYDSGREVQVFGDTPRSLKAIHFNRVDL
jgi:alpha-L-fucosidase